jgi:hypothetical protein
MTLAILVLIAGCDQRPRDGARSGAVAPANAQPTSDKGECGGNIPDIAEYIRSGRDGGKDPFVLFGVRDAAAPNMLLNLWLYENPPNPTRLSLCESVANAIRDDTAEAINLHDVRLNDELRARLPQLQRLQWLSVSVGVTGKDLEWLGRMPRLRGLAMTHADLTQADFSHLRTKDSLQWLTLACSKMTEGDFATLPCLERLELLWFYGPQVTDAYLEHLAEIHLPSLRSLGLYATSVTDRGIDAFCQTYNLEYLDVFRSDRVTPNSVPSICRMDRLQLLGVGGSGIAPAFGTTSAIAELRKSLPKCIVDFGS